MVHRNGLRRDGQSNYEWTRKKVGKYQPATAFSVARGSIQENRQIWNILQLITVNANAEVNLNWDLFQFPLEGMALRCTRPSESGPRAKLIAHPWTRSMSLFNLASALTPVEQRGQIAAISRYCLIVITSHSPIAFLVLSKWFGQCCKIWVFFNAFLFYSEDLGFSGFNCS